MFSLLTGLPECLPTHRDGQLQEGRHGQRHSWWDHSGFVSLKLNRLNMCDAWSMVETQKLPGYETLHSLLFEIFQGKAAWPAIP